ncbi:MAG: metalloregulator ArsR/SmtB family transcription factor [Desulfovibrio sp.]|jgi:ArsR family transcriptional regulator|nr:metalloregulator ArsR/SmtB family transcription factor [Desulfovibrio sp.]
MFTFLTIAKALTDENRARILMVLRDRELCVCQLTAFLDLAPSTTSRHLSILRQARLIESRKKGKWVYYALACPRESSPLVHAALDWIRRSLEDNPVILTDESRLKDILAREQDLCACMDDAAPDSFHSLEIHSLATADEEAAGSSGGRP